MRLLVWSLVLEFANSSSSSVQFSFCDVNEASACLLCSPCMGVVKGGPRIQSPKNIKDKT